MNGEWLIYDPDDASLPWREDTQFGWRASVGDCTEPFDDALSALHAKGNREFRVVTLDEARQIETLRSL